VLGLRIPARAKEAKAMPSTADVSNAFDLIRSHQKNIPVDVSAIARDLGIAVWESRDLPSNVSGKLFRDAKHGGKSGYSILVNGKDAYVRKRFTVAHEIAHYVLHRNEVGEGIVDDTHYRSILSGVKEDQANRLAASILMPMTHVRRLLEQNVPPVDMAKMFQVSRQAMSIRLGEPAVKQTTAHVIERLGTTGVSSTVFKPISTRS
jgi:hypothetical protein